MATASWPTQNLWNEKERDVAVTLVLEQPKKKNIYIYSHVLLWNLKNPVE